MMLQINILLPGLVLLTFTATAECRVSAQATYIPACYIDTTTWAFAGDTTLYRCNNPSYTTCRVDTSTHLCCGPDHYCCENNYSCCLNESWNRYEIAGIATGIAAWVGILIVFMLCTLPRPILFIKRKISKMRQISKIHPDDH